VIQKSGSWFSFNGNKLGQGRDAVKQLIEDNPELAEELEKKIKEKLAKGEDPTKREENGKDQ
jgi:recombination protein RecA